MTAIEQAMQDLRDAIRAEVLAEVVDALKEFRNGFESSDALVDYLDGVGDAIITVEAL